MLGRGAEGKLTTQTPGTAYPPSAAFLSMMFALFWERSIFGGLGAGSAMLLRPGGGMARFIVEGWLGMLVVRRA